MTFREWYYNLPQGETLNYKEKIINAISPSSPKRGLYRFKEILNERLLAGDLEQGAINQIAEQKLVFRKVNPSDRPKRTKRKPIEENPKLL